MKDLWGNIVERALNVIRVHTPPEGLWLAFSGGKDSIVIHDLVERSGVQFEAHHNLTTIDPPELIHFIKREYSQVQIDRPPKTMWKLIELNGLPTRICRYCCRELKERGGRGRVVVTGIRTAESPSRAKRGQFERCTRGGGGKWYLHPIKDWSDEEVWQYIRGRGLVYPRLYDEGWKRIGCVICPFERKVEKSMQRWPKIWAAAKRAARRFYDRKPRACPFETFWANWLRREGKLWDDDDTRAARQSTSRYIWDELEDDDDYVPDDEQGTTLFI